jgi:hypothetical protein
MIDAKYRQGSFNTKSKEELKKLYEVAENVFNNMEDPEDSLKTVNAQNYDRVLENKLYEISNNVSPQQLQSIISENIKTENQNLSFPSTNSIADVLPNFFEEEQKEKMIGDREGDSEDETETQTEGESSNEIVSENSDLLIQDNDNNRAQPLPITNRPLSIDQMSPRGDNNTTAYNERIYKPYLSQFVGRGAK